jgi:hypothetical protein
MELIARHREKERERERERPGEKDDRWVYLFYDF